MLGGETSVEVELDRRFFEEEHAGTSTTPQTDLISMTSESHTKLKREGSGNQDSEGQQGEGSKHIASKPIPVWPAGKRPTLGAKQRGTATGFVLRKRPREENFSERPAKQAKAQDSDRESEGQSGRGVRAKARTQQIGKENRHGRRSRHVKVEKVDEDEVTAMEATIVKRHARDADEDEDIDIIEINLSDENCDQGTPTAPMAETNQSREWQAAKNVQASDATGENTNAHVVQADAMDTVSPSPSVPQNADHSTFYFSSPPPSPHRTPSMPAASSPLRSPSPDLRASTVKNPSTAPLSSSSSVASVSSSSAPTLSLFFSTTISTSTSTSTLSSSTTPSIQPRADPLMDVSIPPQPIVTFPDVVEELLEEGSALYPVVANKRGLAVLPYSYANNEEIWRTWNLGKRKSTEVHSHRHRRAHSNV